MARVIQDNFRQVKKAPPARKTDDTVLGILVFANLVWCLVFAVLVWCLL